MPDHVQLVAGTGVALCALSLLACVLVIPMLYNQMAQLEVDVLKNLDDFKVARRIFVMFKLS